MNLYFNYRVIIIQRMYLGSRENLHYGFCTQNPISTKSQNVVRLWGEHVIGQFPVC